MSRIGHKPIPVPAGVKIAMQAGKIDCVVVYKFDRLSRSLHDFTKMMGIFQEHRLALAVGADD